MTIMRYATTAMIALTTKIVASPGVLAQAGSPDPAAPPTQRLDCIATPAAGAPFSAEALTTWHAPANSGRPELRVTARYYRDRAGRVRVDFVEGRVLLPALKEVLVFTFTLHPCRPPLRGHQNVFVSSSLTRKIGRPPFDIATA